MVDEPQNNPQRTPDPNNYAPVSNPQFQQPQNQNYAPNQGTYAPQDDQAQVQAPVVPSMSQPYTQPAAQPSVQASQPAMPQSTPQYGIQVEPQVAPESSYAPTPQADGQDDEGIRDAQGSSLPEDSPDNPPVTWTAHEYIHSERNTVWFISFAVVVVGLIVASILLLNDYTFAVLIVVMAVALIIYIRRPPRELTYAISPAQGLYVGEKLYAFDEFKAFGIIQDGPHYSVMMIPRKRFSPGVSVFFPEESGERIVDILGQRLPMETLKLDLVDILVRKLRL